MKKNRLSLRALWSALLLALGIATQASGQFNQVTLPAGLQATESEMVVFQNNLIVVLQNAEHNEFTLHKYNGVAFTAIPLPPGYKLYPDTQFEELNNQLYFMPDRTVSTGTAELMGYDGTTLTPIDIPAALIDRSMRLDGHTPFTYNRTLYIELITADSAKIDLTTNTLWIKYDGTTFSRMALGWFACRPEYSLEISSDKKLFQGNMFMRYHFFGTDARELMRYNGSMDEPAPYGPHPGRVADPGGCDMEIYNGFLYVPTHDFGSPGSPFGGGLNRYDGITQTVVAIPPGLRYAKTTLEVYAGKLWGAMHDGSVFPQWYAYDGTNFTATTLPSGTRIHPGGDQRIFQCKLYIVLSTGSAFGPPVLSLFTYSDVAECSTLPTFVERVDIRAYGRERDWCWTGIDVDWTLPIPCTPPSCIDPFMRAALFDKSGKEVWAKTYDKPFQAVYPVDDKESFTATMAIEINKKFEDFIVLDKELVPAGIEELKLQMMPREQKMQLSVATEKDVKVPFIVALQDADGKILWQQKFTAPLSTGIDAPIPVRGTKLRVMIDGSVAQITSLTVFPNPAQGKPTIEVGTNGPKLSTRVTITDFFGKTIYQKDITAPASIQPDLSQAPAGLYIIRTTESGGRQHKQTLVLK